VIIFNVDSDDATQASNMMHEGEKVLSQIPGVRRVITGKAVQKDAKYKFTWLIEFVHENVIDSYRNHPAHVAFADNLFRPIAGDRISIDYR
jgi:fructose-bisphosphate aldolase class II